MIFVWKINKIPKFYTIFARKMPKFYMIIALKYFPNFFFGGGGICVPYPQSPVCYAYRHAI